MKQLLPPLADFHLMWHQSLPLNHLQVLVVDSNIDSQYLLTVLFEEYGVKTIVARSAAEALEMLKKLKPDILIGEIGLRGEDGYSLIRKVKDIEIEREIQIPTIALTVYASENERVKALSVGFDKHLSKPFDIDDLMAMVASLTQQFKWIST